MVCDALSKSCKPVLCVGSHEAAITGWQIDFFSEFELIHEWVDLAKFLLRTIFTKLGYTALFYNFSTDAKG